MGGLARVIIASEPAYQTDRSLRASAPYFRASAISRFASAETPTIVRPRHQPSLDLAHNQPTVTRTMTAAPASR